MYDAKCKGVGNSILAAHYLEGLCGAYTSVHSNYCPLGSIPVHLAVLQNNFAAVHSKHSPVQFFPFDEGDPLVFLKPDEDINLTRALACRKLISDITIR